MYHPKYLITLLSALTITQCVQADIFASMAEMEDLLHTETALISLMDSYLTDLENKSDYLQR